MYGLLHFSFSELKYRLQVLQNSGLRFGYNIERGEHVTPRYNSLQILKLDGRFTLYLTAFLFKTLKTKKPEYLYSILKFRHDCHLLKLRYVNTLTIYDHKLEKYKCCFEHNAVKLYNKYKDFYVNSSSAYIFSFKRRDRLLELQFLYTFSRRECNVIQNQLSHNLYLFVSVCFVLLVV